MGLPQNPWAKAIATAAATRAWVRKLYDVEYEAKAIIAEDKLTGAGAAAVRLRLRREKSVALA